MTWIDQQSTSNSIVPQEATPKKHNQLSVRADDRPKDEVQVGVLLRQRGQLSLLFGIFAFLLLWSGWRMAPTADEPAHLVAGLYTWRSGRCNLYSVNPPLTKLVAAAPLLLADHAEDWTHLPRPVTRPEFSAGSSFIQANGTRTFWLITLGRWALIPFGLLGACICFRWSRELFRSPASGWYAALLWCSSPTILGHGALITADVPAAATGLLAGYCFWRWLSKPTLRLAMECGAAMGLCWLVKFTWLCLPVVWLGLWTVHRLRRPQAGVGWIGGVGQLTVALLVALLLLNAGYGFDGTLTPLQEFQFESALLTGMPVGQSPPSSGNRFRNTRWGEARLPLPAPMLEGLDAQRQDFEGQHNVYFAGRLHPGGCWYFYLAAFVLKESLGFLVLLLTVTLSWLIRRSHRDRISRSSAVWAPAFVVLLLVSAHPSIGYYRYAIPALPFLYIWASQAADLATRWGLPGAIFIWLALLGAICGGVTAAPSAISHVNLLGAGSQHGDHWFVDSNFDWGQDLFALQQWQASHPEAQPMVVCYFGPSSPQLAGVEYIDPSAELLEPAERSPDFTLPPGWYAISATLRHGGGIQFPAARGGLNLASRQAFAVFAAHEPIDRAGPSILIYHIPAP